MPPGKLSPYDTSETCGVRRVCQRSLQRLSTLKCRCVGRVAAIKSVNKTIGFQGAIICPVKTLNVKQKRFTRIPSIHQHRRKSNTARINQDREHLSDMSKVVVEGRPSTTPSKPCVRLSLHTAFPFGVAFKDTLGINTTLLMILLIASPEGDLGIFKSSSSTETDWALRISTLFPISSTLLAS